MAVKIIIPELEDRDFMYREYIEKNRSVQDLATQFGVSKDTIIRKVVKHGLKKDKKLSHKLAEKTYLEKYGVENPQQLEEFKNKSKQTNLKKYGVEYGTQNKEIKERIKQTNLERYGTTTYAGSKEGKEKIMKTVQERYGVDNPGKIPGIREKMKQTMLEKYGTDSPFGLPDFEEKRKKTNFEKYGVEYSLQNKEIQAKSKKTLMERYGVDHYSKTDEFKVKMKNTITEKYGVDSYSKSEVFKEKMRQRRIDFLTQHNIDIARINTENLVEIIKSLSEYYQKDYGYKPSNSDIAYLLNYDYTYIEQCTLKNNLKDYIEVEPPSSLYEHEIADFVRSLGIENVIEHETSAITPYEIDVYIPDYKIGIEFNGNYRHSEYKRPIKYHQDKSLRGLENGIFIYHIFEYERNDPVMNHKIKMQLRNLFGKNERKIPARKCVVREIDLNTKNEFLDLYHIQGADSSSIKLGLFFGDELVSIMCFSKQKFFGKYSHELSRFCSKENTTVIGGASKLFKYFIKNYTKSGETIVSYSALVKTRGTIYETLGFKRDHIVEPRYIRFKKNDIKKRYQTQFKNEAEIMHENGYFRIYDAGMYVWVYQVT